MAIANLRAVFQVRYILRSWNYPDKIPRLIKNFIKTDTTPLFTMHRVLVYHLVFLQCIILYFGIIFKKKIVALVGFEGQIRLEVDKIFFALSIVCYASW